jgi:hypothetical protein
MVGDGDEPRSSPCVIKRQRDRVSVQIHLGAEGVAVA